jgi:hypothetical protein
MFPWFWLSLVVLNCDGCRGAFTLYWSIHFLWVELWFSHVLQLEKAFWKGCTTLMTPNQVFHMIPWA